MHIVSSKLRNFSSSFMSLPQDLESIWRMLLIDVKPWCDNLKRLLIINEPDCLDFNQTQYQREIERFDLHRLHEEQYIRSSPRILLSEHEQVKTYLMVQFDDFVPTENTQYRDCVINFSIVCHLDVWEIEDYGLRPWLIAGYVDGILDKARLTGIGTLQFSGAAQMILNEHFAGVTMNYVATHGHDDETKVDANAPSMRDLR